MNDRAMNVLHAYGFTVREASRGRGAVLCDTDQGMKILKEYSGSGKRLELQEKLLAGIRARNEVKVEQLVRNQEGELYTPDSDQTKYIVKDYFAGRECNRREPAECRLAVKTLAKLHQAMVDPKLAKEDQQQPVSLAEEFARHNRELRRVRKYIRQKGRKSPFERFLYQHYDGFLEQALRVETELEMKQRNWQPPTGFCHGDYQYHNLLYADGQLAVINFERFCLDSQMRDLYLFLRKLLEKNNWPLSYGLELLNVYQELRPLTEQDKEQLYYRFAYPEKFWKIVNFYYNSGKAWIPDKNQEKLEKLLEQEEAHGRFVNELRRL